MKSFILAGFLVVLAACGGDAPRKRREIGGSPEAGGPDGGRGNVGMVRFL